MPVAKTVFRIAPALPVLFGLAACAPLRAPEVSAKPVPSLLLVVSLDGFRWDYPELHGAPTLLALASAGARAASLVPSFPSKTYPNHYTIATGLRPEHHGIVANTMWDPLWQARFSLADRSSVEDGRWWEGEPIWATAERAGVVSASSFWPGTEAEISGVRPTHWKRYDAAANDETRVDEALGWLDLPAKRRPRLLLLYFSEPDHAGHVFGPAAPETGLAVRHVDALLARLAAGLAARGLAEATDWIVVSDHGMTATSTARTIVLEEHVELADVEVDDANIVAAIRPRAGREEAVFRRLAAAHPSLHVAHRDEVPGALHYRTHRRIAPLVAWVDPGWQLYVSRADRDRDAMEPSQGAHGYDPRAADMHGLFIAHGPSFRRGVSGPPLDNIDLYELFCRLLRIQAAPNDGTARSTRWALATP